MLTPRCPKAVRLYLLTLFLFVGLSGLAAAADLDAHKLRAFLSAEGLEISGQSLDASMLRRLYSARGFAPLWMENHMLTPMGRAALTVLGQSFDQGLDPAAYYLPEIQSGYAASDNARAVGLELLISSALLRYVNDVAVGRLEPKEENPELFVYPDPPDSVPVLEQAVASGDLVKAMTLLPPTYVQYERLKRAVEAYRDLANRGGWQQIPDGTTLKPGMRDPRVVALRARLAVTDGAQMGTAADDMFDTALVAVVKRVQARHGLEADGLVGKDSVAALNISANDRIRTLLMNMERWRWLPRALENRLIVINAANFRLYVIEDRQIKHSMRIIVGKPYRRTPIFSSRLSNIVFNPDWTVPPRIAREDLLPKIKKDPSFLTHNGYKVLSDWTTDATVLDPQSIDWSVYGKGYFPFKLRQLPGASNALGQVKFMLPNRYHVYLHDTPSREYFDRQVRSFSSGCVRLSEPFKLVEWLLYYSKEWNTARVQSVLRSGQTVAVPDPSRTPVYFTYFTAWVDDQNVVQFRPDIYGRDAALAAALANQLLTLSTGE